MGIYRSAQVLVVIRHTSGLDNLYFSDETGTYYSLSLYNIILDVQNGLDLELVSYFHCADLLIYARIFTCAYIMVNRLIA